MPNLGTEQLLLTHYAKNIMLLAAKERRVDYHDFKKPEYRAIYRALTVMLVTGLSTSENGQVESPSYEEVSVCIRDHDYLPNHNLKDQTWLGDFYHNLDISQSFEYALGEFKRQLLIEKLIKDGGFKGETFYSNYSENADELTLKPEFISLSAADIVDTVKSKVSLVSGEFVRNGTSDVQSAFDNLESLLDATAETPEVGPSLQGIYFNAILGGAISSRLCIRSASSGMGKTRAAVGDACLLAFPLHYDWKLKRWIKEGRSEKVCLIITEQSMEEVQMMMLAYLSGVNEAAIKRNTWSQEQKRIVYQALKVVETFQDNLTIIRVPNPSISLLDSVIREQAILKKIKYVFYDYVFVSPSLLGEFRGQNLRNDEILLMFSDALKKLAVDLDIFIMTSTQVNAKADDNKDVRNEATLAGSRAIINKADFGCVMARPTKEELIGINDLCEAEKIKWEAEHIEPFQMPNCVTDVYKNRGGADTQMRIWSYLDLGTMKRHDYFVTDSRNEGKTPTICPDYKIPLEEEDIEKLNLCEKELNEQ